MHPASTPFLTYSMDLVSFSTSHFCVYLSGPESSSDPYLEKKLFSYAHSTQKGIYGFTRGCGCPKITNCSFKQPLQTHSVSIASMPLLCAFLACGSIAKQNIWIKLLLP